MSHCDSKSLRLTRFRSVRLYDENRKRFHAGVISTKFSTLFSFWSVSTEPKTV